MMYRGNEKTSSATNIVSRSPAEENTIIPPTAKSVSGKISVCARPALRAASS